MNQLVLICFLYFSLCSCVFAKPVVTTIQPIHALVTAVMGEEDSVEQLIPATVSPHHFRLKPSQARAIQQAKIIFWVDPGIESYLTNPLKKIKNSAEIVQLSEIKGLKKLPNRPGGSWCEEHGHYHAIDNDGHDHGSTDPHIWLDPLNAIQMVKVIAAKLSQTFPEHKQRYQANAKKTIKSLMQLTIKLTRQLRPYRNQPFLVFHDAYQYFETRFKLNSMGALLVSPQHLHSAKRVQELRKMISNHNIQCIFTEVQFNSKIADKLSTGTSVKIRTLDPHGANITTGPNAYHQLIQNLADEIQVCLPQASPKKSKHLGPKEHEHGHDHKHHHH